MYVLASKSESELTRPKSSLFHSHKSFDFSLSFEVGYFSISFSFIGFFFFFLSIYALDSQSVSCIPESDARSLRERGYEMDSIGDSIG